MTREQVKQHKDFIHRVKRDIFAIDSTTLMLSLGDEITSFLSLVVCYSSLS
jgi:hypothetical protein